MDSSSVNSAQLLSLMKSKLESLDALADHTSKLSQENIALRAEVEELRAVKKGAHALLAHVKVLEDKVTTLGAVAEEKKTLEQRCILLEAALRQLAAKHSAAAADGRSIKQLEDENILLKKALQSTSNQSKRLVSSILREAAPFMSNGDGSGNDF